MWFYVRSRYQLVQNLVQYLLVNDKESSKQFYKKTKQNTEQAQTRIHKSSVGTRSCKITFVEMKSATNSGWAVDQKLYITVKWIHVLSFVSLLFLADLGNIWKKIFSRRRHASLGIRLKSVGGGLVYGRTQETFSFALLLFLYFQMSVRNEFVLYIFTL